jgi:hypothetical protein
MSLTVFLAICVLGCDFLLYFLFQWVYGEKRRNRLRRLATSREKSHGEEPRVRSFPQHPIQHRNGYF